MVENSQLTTLCSAPDTPFLPPTVNLSQALRIRKASWETSTGDAHNPTATGLICQLLNLWKNYLLTFIVLFHVRQFSFHV